MMRDYHQHRQQERSEQHRAEWLAKQSLNKTDSEIRLAYSLTQTGQDFANALEDRGYILSNVNSADIAMHERRVSWREKEHAERLQALGRDPATEKMRPEPALEKGEFVVVINTGAIIA